MMMIELRTRIASNGAVGQVRVIQTVGVRGRQLRTDTRSMAACEEEATATLLDQSARQPTEQEELAGIRVTQLGIAEEHFPIRHH